MTNNNLLTLGIAAGILIVSYIAFGGSSSLFSVAAPTTSTYDFQYNHKPTVYDAGVGQGFVQIYPANMHIGTEFTFPDNSAPIGAPYKLGDYIQVLRSVS